MHLLRAVMIPGAALALLTGPGIAGSAVAAITPAQAGTAPPTVLHVGQIDQQDVATQGGCERGTLVEPDVVVSPFNPDIQVAVAQDCRFFTGGAVGISYTWTHDGGAHWRHAPIPGLTKAVGGVWDRASDPVVAFGADGSVYVSALVYDITGCAIGETVSRSTDGGATFGSPVLAHESTSCAMTDDKDWLVADTQPGSPFDGRIYLFWTEFLATSSGRITGSPQLVRWSDDHGMHWSATHLVSPSNKNAQDSQPFIGPGGRITDAYEASRQHFDGGPRRPPGERTDGSQAAAGGVSLLARTSTDGGATWSNPALIASGVGSGPAGIRCCFPLASGDRVTGRLYAVWTAKGPGTLDPVMLSSSAGGRRWSRPVQVTPRGNPDVQYINAAVAAAAGRVFVTYGARNTATGGGRVVQQEMTWSGDGGVTFATPIGLGPPSDLKYAAVDRGLFPGDYTGLSATGARLTAVWCVSSKPLRPASAYHQTLYAAVLSP